MLSFMSLSLLYFVLSALAAKKRHSVDNNVVSLFDRAQSCFHIRSLISNDLLVLCAM